MKTSVGVVVTPNQSAVVSFQYEDFTTPEHIERHAKYFADLDEAERRGGSVFVQMGNLARERIEGKRK